MAILITYNINGIRAAIRRNFSIWLKEFNADIVCLQEIKANTTQFDTEIFEELGYNVYLNPAQRPGYSGVALLSKKKPTNIEYGCGMNEIDCEGRIIRADFENYSVMSVYFPSGSSGALRQQYKFKFLDKFLSREKCKSNSILDGDVKIISMLLFMQLHFFKF